MPEKNRFRSTQFSPKSGLRNDIGYFLIKQYIVLKIHMFILSWTLFDVLVYIKLCLDMLVIDRVCGACMIFNDPKNQHSAQSSYSSRTTRLMWNNINAALLHAVDSRECESTTRWCVSIYPNSCGKRNHGLSRHARPNFCRILFSYFLVLSVFCSNSLIGPLIKMLILISNSLSTWLIYRVLRPRSRCPSVITS